LYNLFGEYNFLSDKRSACLDFLKRPTLQIFSENFVASKRVRQLGTWGFKYSPPLAPTDYRIHIKRCIFKTVPAFQLKVARMLKGKDLPPRDLTIKPPPSKWEPAIDWNKYPEWSDYFKSIKSSLWKTYRESLNPISSMAPTNAENEVRKIYIKTGIEEVLRKDHLIMKADKDPSMIIVDKELFRKAEERLLTSLNVKHLEISVPKVINDCQQLVNTALALVTTWGAITLPNSVIKWWEESAQLSVIPKLKLLFKTHKPKNKWWLGGLIPPARPIVTQHLWLTKGCGEIITQSLGKILKWVRLEHPVLLPQNSAQLMRFFESCNFLTKGNMKVVTADFDSLYSNLPIKLVVESSRFWLLRYTAIVDKSLSFLSTDATNFATVNVPSYLPPFPCEVHTLLDLLLFLVLTLNVFTSSDGQLFAQCEGIAMGLSCAPVLADLTLAYLEVSNKQVFEELMVVRYLDDLLIIGDQNALTEAIPKVSNVYPLSVGWGTVADSAPYLDMFICCLPDKIVTGVYFKPENNAQYLPYCSGHIYAHKTSWLKGELIRYIRICSSEEQFIIARTRLVLAAFARGYSAHIIKRFLSTVKWEDRESFLRKRVDVDNSIKVCLTLPSGTVKGTDIPVGVDTRIIRCPPPNLNKIVNGLQDRLVCFPHVRRQDCNSSLFFPTRSHNPLPQAKQLYGD